jgi:16S rRNA (uracil1498-N3)-methyltransferase
MTRRYFAASLPTAGGIVSLDEHERHHAINVMRIQVGESVVLFDGNGHESIATVQTASKRDVCCETAPATAVDRENTVTTSLGVAMPKGDRSKELVERLTELGVNRLVPLHCRRTPWQVPESAITKWKRLVIDSCKQSGRNHLMQITSPMNIQDWLTTKELASPSLRYFAHPSADLNQITPRLSKTLSSKPSEVFISIGPEGGFSDEEIAIADKHGWQRLPLGKRIYRIETAAILATIKAAAL